MPSAEIRLKVFEGPSFDRKVQFGGGFRSVPGNSRPIIGLLSSSTVEPWAARQWEGVVEAAQDYNVELVSYIGGVLRSARYDEQANVMYELAASSELDGLIVWSTALGWLLSRQEMAEFFSRFGTTPMVSMEMRFPGLPSVLMDDYGGMRAVIDHLIEEHGRRRIAFIRGPSTHEGFEARYRAYLDSLEAHGLALDSRLVSSESTELDGVGATRALLGEVGPTFDAIAGADDLLVLGALPVLAERGLRVPEDVAVAGFDDLPEDLTTVPPLTSAEPPFKAMGRRAVEILVGMIEGRPAPEAETLPVGLIRRRSCGCPGTPEARKAPSSPRNRGPVEGFALSRGAGEAGPDELWACMAAALREGWPELDESKLRGLWDRFASEARGGERGSFLAAFERELDLAADAEADPTRWLRLLSTMQRIALRWIAALPYETRLRAGELWVLGQELAAEAIRKGIARRRVSLADRHAAVRLLSERLGGVHEVGEQMEVVSKHLSQLGIPGCHLSLFVRPEDPTGEARLVLAHGGSGGRVLPPGGLLFPAPELLPRSAAPLERGLSRLALALYFGRARIGFVVFDIASSEDALICEILRWLLSGALKGSEELLAEGRRRPRRKPSSRNSSTGSRTASASSPRSPVYNPTGPCIPRPRRPSPRSRRGYPRSARCTRSSSTRAAWITSTWRTTSRASWTAPPRA
jgi:DNA-binding LacI/PurR family transcriptional regulator